MSSTKFAKKSDARPYKSLYGDIYVTPSAYLAEKIFRRKSEKKNSGSLPEFFWRLPKYKNEFIREVSYASTLLKQFSALPILQALDSYKSNKILSLRNKQLLPIIEEFNLLHKESEFKESVEEKPTRKPFGGSKNLWSELNGR